MNSDRPILSSLPGVTAPKSSFPEDGVAVKCPPANHRENACNAEASASTDEPHCLVITLYTPASESNTTAEKLLSRSRSCAPIPLRWRSIRRTELALAHLSPIQANRALAACAPTSNEG